MIYLIRFALVAPLLMLGICFAQSAADKWLHQKANKTWLNAHFAQSPLRGQVAWMLPLLSVLETCAGLLSLFVSGAFIGFGITSFQMPATMLLAIVLCMVCLLALFAGQRLAKDYAGAAALVPYMLLATAQLALLFWDTKAQWSL